MLLRSWTTVFVLSALGAALAHAGPARDVLIGPVTLAPKDALAVTVANLEIAGVCAEPVEVAFFEHGAAARTSSAMREAPAAERLHVLGRGAVTLQPGESTTLRVQGEAAARMKTIQAQVRSPRPVFGTEPCVAISGTVSRWTGETETIGGAQLSDELSILRPYAEDPFLERPSTTATCVGSDSCDDLISLCEQQGDECSFTCHLAIPDGEGQACVFGSTND